MKIQDVPVLLLTGYLGSGKTTLLNRILSNKRGIKFAVIVNDIGEVNIDADLIQQGGVVGKSDDSLVALQNGCICCTLKMDLVQQLHDITSMQKFDYIVIEASGICEPEPIAQTICSLPQMGYKFIKDGLARLDCIVTVVDALRLKDEFGCGDNLKKHDLDEEDIENLVIQQIEFCNIILMNKASEVSREELNRIEAVIRAIQPKAQIIECDYCDVDLDKLINTDLFNYGTVASSATWIQAVEAAYDDEQNGIEHHPFEDDDDDDEDEHDEHHHHHHDDDDDDEHEEGHHHHHDDDDDDDDEHEEHHHHHDDDDEDEDHDHDEHEHHHHHHHHHHDHDEGEAEEYGIGTYVYYNRRPFDLNKFDNFVAKYWPKNIIRAKGLCYFNQEYDICYLFEQAGKQFSLRNVGQWYATMPKDQLMELMIREPLIKRDWDEIYGDRMQKLVFIGQKLDKAALKKALDACMID